MGRKTNERKEIERKLKKAGDKIFFPEHLYRRIERMIQDMNRKARASRMIMPDEQLYSQETTEGGIFVTRNL